MINVRSLTTTRISSPLWTLGSPHRSPWFFVTSSLDGLLFGRQFPGKKTQGSRWYPMLKYRKWWLLCFWRISIGKKARWWSNNWKVKVTSFWDLRILNWSPFFGKKEKPKDQTLSQKLTIHQSELGWGHSLRGWIFPFKTTDAHFPAVRQPGFPAVGMWSQCRGRCQEPVTQLEGLQLMMLAAIRDHPIRRWAYRKTVFQLQFETIWGIKWPLWTSWWMNYIERPFPTVSPLVHWNK